MQPKTSTYTIINHAKLIHSKQTFDSVFCPVNAEFAHHNPDKSFPYDENVSI